MLLKSRVCIDPELAMELLAEAGYPMVFGDGHDWTWYESPDREIALSDVFLLECSQSLWLIDRLNVRQWLEDLSALTGKWIW